MIKGVLFCTILLFCVTVLQDVTQCHTILKDRISRQKNTILCCYNRVVIMVVVRAVVIVVVVHGSWL